MNVYNFILEIIKYDRIEDILENYKIKAKKVMYMRLDILLNLDFALFPKSKFNHLIGNTNTAKLKLLKNLNKHYNNEKLFSGNSTGCSDITLQNINDGTYIFITSKYPKSSEDKKTKIC